MRQAALYETVKHYSTEEGYPIQLCCEVLHVSRAAYYRWLRGEKASGQKQTKELRKSWKASIWSTRIKGIVESTTT